MPFSQWSTYRTQDISERFMDGESISDQEMAHLLLVSHAMWRRGIRPESYALYDDNVK